MQIRVFFALFLIGPLLFFSKARAQQINPDAFGYYNEAIKYSRTFTGGSARMMGLSGAGVALGADISTANINPAGLGFYRRSEFSFSPAFNFANSNATFLNNTTRDGRQSFNVGNFGMVFAGAKDDIEPGVFRGGSFAITFTRKNNFQNQFSYSGINYRNSMTDFFVDISQGINPNSLGYPPTTLQELAYHTFLTDADNLGYFTYNEGLPGRQEETVTERGAQNQWDFAYGANFDDRIYIGASVGVARVNNSIEKYYKETVIYDQTQSQDLLRFSLYDIIETRGTGINFNIGTIIRPSDWLRLGATIQTPTYYSLNEEFSTYVRSEFFDQNYEESSPLSAFRYNLTTPLRVSGGAAVFAGKNGFVSADIEYVDYTAASLRAPQNNFLLTGDNQTIRSIYRPTVNFKIGSEYRIDIYRLRGGFAVYGDPHRAQLDNINRTMVNISLGGGIRLPDYYFDLSITNSRFQGIYSPYTLSDGLHPTASLRNRNTNVMLSFGTFF